MPQDQHQDNEGAPLSTGRRRPGINADGLPAGGPVSRDLAWAAALQSLAETGEPVSDDLLTRAAGSGLRSTPVVPPPAPRVVRIHLDGDVRLPADIRDRFGFVPGTQAEIEETPMGLLLRPSDPPLAKVYVEPTAACNLNCGTCVRNTWSEKPGTMTMETYGKLIDGLRGVPSLHTMAFWGLGEPLLHPGIMEMVKAAHDLGARTEMITNGLLLDEEKARGLIAAGLDSLVISVDGATPETHAGARPGADLNVVLKNVKRLHELQRRTASRTPEIGLEFVATRRNIEQLPGLPRLAYQMMASFVVVTNVLPYSAEYKDDILYGLSGGGQDALGRSPWRPEMRLPQMDAGSAAFQPLLELARQASIVDPLRGPSPELQGYCRFVRQGAVGVAWDGGVSPCIPLMHSYTSYVMGREKSMKRYVLGNVNDTPITGIWALDEYRRFRQRVIKFDFSPCTSCGGCQLAESNEEDCLGNEFPACGDCLWARGIIQCP